MFQNDESIDVDFDDDYCFKVNTYHFYFLFGSQNANCIKLHGKLKYKDCYTTCTINLSSLTKTVYVKAKPALTSLVRHQFHQSTEQGMHFFKEQVEVSLKPIIQNMQTYSSSVVQMQTVYSNHIEYYLKVVFNISEEFLFDNIVVQDNSYIDYIYGLKQDTLMMYLMEKGIKGTCWLEIETIGNAASLYTSEITCHSENVSVLTDGQNSLIGDEIPTLKVLVLEVVNQPIDTGKLEPVAIAIGLEKWTHKQISLTGTTIVFSTNKKMRNTTICKNSGEILEQVMKITKREQADIIICSDVQQFIHSSNVYAKAFKDIFLPHIVIDLRHFVQEFAPNLLSDNCLFEQSSNTSEFIRDRIRKCLVLTNELDVISTYMFIASATGCSLLKAPSSKQMTRVETMLLYELYHSSIILPEKRLLRPPDVVTVKGGIVIEPNIGFFNKLILGFDVVSLYPSIIQEYNISFTSTDHVLPSLMKCLFDLRQKLIIQQQSVLSALVKRLANSVYGCLSSIHSIFYNPQVANDITQAGRRLLSNLITKIVVDLQCNVICGNTDSVFVEMSAIEDYHELMKKVLRFQESFAADYQYIQLKLEGVFSHAVIIGKHQYALRYHDSYRVSIGHDIKTANWIVKGVLRSTLPPICHQIFHYFLQQVTMNQTLLERKKNLLAMIESKMLSNDINDYVMRVQIQKIPNFYHDNTPYGSIIQRRNLQKLDEYRQNDLLSYVICDDGTDNPFYMRSYDLKEFAAVNFRIDKEYYKEKQILPFIQKLCSTVPEYMNMNEVHSLLKPPCSATFITSEKRPQWQEKIFPFYFRCIHCSMYVVVDERYGYENFLKCNSCHGNFADAKQIEAIHFTLETCLKDHLDNMEERKKWVLVKGISEQVRRKIQHYIWCTERQFCMQLSIWKDIFHNMQVSLEWFSNDGLKGNLKYELFKLFGDMLTLIDTALNVGKWKENRVINFTTLYTD